MASILINASKAFDQSLAEFSLDQELWDLINGGLATKCEKTECGSVTTVNNSDGSVTIKVDCGPCE